jgi:hypothetical protein
MSHKHKRKPKSITRNGVTYKHRSDDTYRSDGGGLLEAYIIADLLSGANDHGCSASSDFSSFSSGGGGDFDGGGGSDSYSGGSSYGGDSGGGYSDSGGGDSGGGGDGGGGGGE